MARQAARRWRRIIVASVAVIILLPVIVVGGSFLTWGPGLAFDAGTWQELEDPTGIFFSHLPGGDNRRARMVDDLLSQHLPVGAPAGTVKRLLGRPGAHGDGLSYYMLLWRPRPDQEIVAWLRWRTTNACLEVIVEDGRAVSARVRP